MVWLGFLVNYTDFTVMQIEMETEILSGARHALFSTRECQAMLNLGEYLCCSSNTSSAAQLAQQSKSPIKAGTSPLSVCDAAVPQHLLKFSLSFVVSPTQVGQERHPMPPVGIICSCVFSRTLLCACIAGDKGKFFL